MKLKKGSITLSSTLLIKLIESIQGGKSISLEFLSVERGNEIYFFPKNNYSESIIYDNNEFVSTKIRLVMIMDEIESMIQTKDQSQPSEDGIWVWEIKKRNPSQVFESIFDELLFYSEGSKCMKDGEYIGITISFAERYKFFKSVHAENKHLLSEEESIHSRNLLWQGETNFFKIQNIKIGCIGAGGLINPFVIQAMHQGYKQFVLVDRDKLEYHNFNRFLGVRKSDLGSFKVEVLKGILNQFSEQIEVEAITEFLPEKVTLEALSACDILVGGVDNDYSRLQIQILALALEKPYLDMGSGVVLKDNSSLNPEVDERGGQIKLFIPGNACISCMGLKVNEVKDFKTRQMDIIRGYIQGTELTPPSILTLNSTIAGMGLKLMTDYILEGTSINHLKYNEKNFKLYSVKSEKNQFCKVCSNP